MEPHVYKDERFISKVHDYGDEYHNPEDESKNTELLKAVRKLKRKYRDFGEWCDAMTIFHEYANWIIEKYGGKKRFKFLRALGQVDDYIPFKPELRRIRQNRPYVKDNLPRPVFVNHEKTWIPFEPKVKKHVKVKFSMKEKKGAAYQFDMNDIEMEMNLAEHLDMIQNFYARTRVKTVKMSKKHHRREIIRRQREAMKNKDKSLEQRLDEYMDAQYLGELVDYPNLSEQGMVMYKGAFVSAEENNEIMFMQALADKGFKLNKRVLSKSGRKVVRQMNKPSKDEKKKKKKRKKVKKNLEKITGKPYVSFADYEKEMKSLTMKGLDDIYDNK